MAQAEEEVRVRLIFDTNQFQTEMQRTDSRVEQSENKFKRFGSLLKNIFTANQYIDFAKNIIGTITGITEAVIDLTKETAKTEIALKGLSNTAKTFGQNSSLAKEYAKELASDGLMTIEQSAQTLKNLMGTGFNLSESMNIAKSMKDIGAFNNVIGDLGQAMVDSSKGIKTGSIELIENIGLTQKLSTVMKLAGVDTKDGINLTTDAAQRQAVYNSILKEGANNLGSAAEYSKTFSGTLATTETNLNKVKAALGDVIKEDVASFLSLINENMQGLIKTIKEFNLLKKEIQGKITEEDERTRTINQYEETLKKLKEMKEKEMKEGGLNPFDMFLKTNYEFSLNLTKGKYEKALNITKQELEAKNKKEEAERKITLKKLKQEDDKRIETESEEKLKKQIEKEKKEAEKLRIERINKHLNDKTVSPYGEAEAGEDYLKYAENQKNINDEKLKLQEEYNRNKFEEEEKAYKDSELALNDHEIELINIQKEAALAKLKIDLELKKSLVGVNDELTKTELERIATKKKTDIEIAAEKKIRSENNIVEDKELQSKESEANNKRIEDREKNLKSIFQTAADEAKLIKDRVPEVENQKILDATLADSKKGMADVITDAMSDIIQGTTKYDKEYGLLLTKILQTTLTNKATEAGVEAVWQVAEGMASLASTFGATDGGHFATAAMYGQTALLAGGAAALTSGVIRGQEAGNPPEENKKVAESNIKNQNTIVYELDNDSIFPAILPGLSDAINNDNGVYFRVVSK